MYKSEFVNEFLQSFFQVEDWPQGQLLGSQNIIMDIGSTKKIVDKEIVPTTKTNKQTRIKLSDSEDYKAKRRKVIRDSEAKRREREKTLYETLRTLLPHGNPKMTREDIMQQTVDLINVLQEQGVPVRSPFSGIDILSPISSGLKDIQSAFKMVFSHTIDSFCTAGACNMKSIMSGCDEALELALRSEQSHLELYASYLNTLCRTAYFDPIELSSYALRTIELYHEIENTTGHRVEIHNGDVGSTSYAIYGVVLSSLGYFTESENHIRKALQIQKENPFALMALMMLYWFRNEKMNMKEKAVFESYPIKSIDPENVPGKWCNSKVKGHYMLKMMEASYKAQHGSNEKEVLDASACVGFMACSELKKIPGVVNHAARLLAALNLHKASLNKVKVNCVIDETVKEINSRGIEGFFTSSDLLRMQAVLLAESSFVDYNDMTKKLGVAEKMLKQAVALSEVKGLDVSNLKANIRLALVYQQLNNTTELAGVMSSIGKLYNKLSAINSKPPRVLIEAKSLLDQYSTYPLL